MENQEESAAKKEEDLFWRKCPICTPSPGFKDFMFFMRHMEEHLRHTSPGARIELGSDDYLEKRIARELDPFLQGDENENRAPRRKMALECKVLLPQVSDWLEQALTNLPEINAIETSNVLVAAQLVDLAKQLLDSFREQREYLLAHEGALRDTGMDPKWPRKAGGRIRFVAESMAGAEWGLTPSTSREFIRQAKPKRGAIPAADQRWWGRGLTAASPDQEETPE